MYQRLQVRHVDFQGLYYSWLVGMGTERKPIKGILSKCNVEQVEDNGKLGNYPNRELKLI